MAESMPPRGRRTRGGGGGAAVGFIASLGLRGAMRCGAASVHERSRGGRVFASAKHCRVFKQCGLTVSTALTATLGAIVAKCR